MADNADVTCQDCGEEAAKRNLQSPALTAACTPTRTMNRVPPRKQDPAWERGVAGEHRPDGSFMPYLRPADQTPMKVKEFADNRTKYEKVLREMRSSKA